MKRKLLGKFHVLATLDCSSQYVTDRLEIGTLSIPGLYWRHIAGFLHAKERVYSRGPERFTSTRALRSILREELSYLEPGEVPLQAINAMIAKAAAFFRRRKRK